jgi:hypothetical protein
VTRDEIIAKLKETAPALRIDRLWRQRSSESSAPSTTVRSLRELQWSPSPAIAGADVCYPANVPQFFAKFSAPRSESAKMV